MSAKNYRLKVFLEDRRTAFYQDREFLCECESIAARHEELGRKVEFWILENGKEVRRFMHDVSDPLPYQGEPGLEKQEDWA
jgi:hypothetical protein